MLSLSAAARPPKKIDGHALDPFPLQAFFFFYQGLEIWLLLLPICGCRAISCTWGIFPKVVQSPYRPSTQACLKESSAAGGYIILRFLFFWNEVTLFYALSRLIYTDQGALIKKIGLLYGYWTQMTALTFLLDLVAFDSGSASKYLLRSYKNSFNGFAAELTEEEVKRLSGE